MTLPFSMQSAGKAVSVFGQTFLTLISERVISSQMKQARMVQIAHTHTTKSRHALSECMSEWTDSLTRERKSSVPSASAQKDYAKSGQVRVEVRRAAKLIGEPRRNLRPDTAHSRQLSGQSANYYAKAA